MKTISRPAFTKWLSMQPPSRRLNPSNHCKCFLATFYAEKTGKAGEGVWGIFIPDWAVELERRLIMYPGRKPCIGLINCKKAVQVLATV